MRAYLFILSLVLIASSCTQKRSEMIVGKWKIDDMVTPVKLDHLPQDKKAEVEVAMREHLALMKAQGYYEFQPDGKAISFDGRTEFKMRWRMDKEENKVYLKPEEDPGEVIFEIEKMEARLFVLYRKEKDGELRITLKK